MADRYFQIQLQAQSTLAAYQPLCIQGDAEAGLDGAILFPAVGERWITLPGDPETLQVSLLAAEPGQETPSPVASVRRDRSAALTLLDLSHWLFARSSRVQSGRSCGQLRLSSQLSIEQLTANLHEIYLSHLRHPDADFELRCRLGAELEMDLSALRQSCQQLHASARTLGVIGSGGQPVDIIIPTYGQPGYTLRCIASVLRDLLIHRRVIKGRLDVQLMVVDDAHPQQHGQAVLQWLADQGCLDFRVNSCNLGFLESCNQAVSRSRDDSLIVLLNNDIEVLPGWLTGLVDTIEQDIDVGLVGSKLIYPDGRLQEAGGIVWQDGSAWNFGRLKNPAHPDYNYARSVDYVSGASIMVPRRHWDAAGGFDQRFIPAYYEDTDLALTLRDRGLKVIYQPSSQAIHHEGISCGTDLNSGVKAYQVTNQVSFLEKWQSRLRQHQPAGECLERAKHRGALGRILVIENQLLEPEGDAGSLFMINYCLALRELGYTITYVPTDNLTHQKDKAALMGARGIQVICRPEIASVEDIFKSSTECFDLILLARPGNFPHLESISRLVPQTPVVYFTHDLHHLRTLRTARNLTDRKERRRLQQRANLLREQESEIFSRVDLVLHISEEENRIAQALHPHPAVVLPPVVTVPATSGFGRSGQQVLFVGNFSHSPNITAAEWLTEAIWPRVRAMAPDMQLLIVGRNPPHFLKRGDGIDVLGYVEDLSALMQTVDIGIAPLKEGAGVKGKVLSALAHGLPMVTTTIGAEGITDATRSCSALLVADTAAALAAEVLALRQRPEQQRRALAENGRRFIQRHFGPEALVSRFKQMFETLELPYEQHVSRFQPYTPRGNDQLFNSSNSFTQGIHPLA